MMSESSLLSMYYDLTILLQGPEMDEKQQRPMIRCMVTATVHYA